MQHRDHDPSWDIDVYPLKRHPTARSAPKPRIEKQVNCTLPFGGAGRDFTCSLIATSVEFSGDFCPNFKSFFTLFCDKCQKPFHVVLGCHKRTCSFCAAKREKQLIWKYQDGCSKMQNPKLLTLTAPYFRNPRVGSKIMRAAYRRLRQRLPFKNMFGPGIYGFHFLPKPGGMWYIHIHALVDTKYIPQALISTAWSKCLPGAEVVDIRKAWSPKGGLKYILGYITATQHLAGHEDEFNAAMHGARLVSTTSGLFASPLPTSCFVCPNCGDASYGYAHKTTMPKKWHNFIRRTKPNIEQCSID